MDATPARNPHRADKPPKTCRVDDACVISVADLETSEDFMDTCHHLQLAGKRGYARVVVDLTQFRKVQSPFFAHLAGFLRDEARRGGRWVVAGPTQAIRAFMRTGGLSGPKA